MASLLVIDDDPLQRRFIASGLRAEGFSVTSASSAIEAYGILDRAPHDAVLVDLMMPVVNGLECARTLRTMYPNVVVVLMSAYHLGEQQLARADVGAVGFVPKPFTPAVVAQFLREKIARGPASSRPPKKPREAEKT